MKNEDVARLGRTVWTVVGVVVLLVVAWTVLSALAVVVVPLILALFPATLLKPIARWLEEWRLPPAAAAFLTLIAGLALFLGIAAGAVTLVVEQIPEVIDSAGQGVERVEELVGRVVPGFEIPAVDELRDMILSEVQSAADDSEGSDPGVASQALSVASSAIGFLTSVVLLVVVLFFYLKDGRRLIEGLADYFSPGFRGRFLAFADEAWDTLGAYFRGQLLIALSDAVLIGIGLVILGVPLVLPLSAIIFFGGLFPVIGAFLTGTIAVLVGFSDGGLGIGLAVLGIVVFVQQLEGNLLEPLILSRVIDLEPLVVLLAITAGAILLGVLGAFLAVPVTAVAKKLVVRIREGAGEPAEAEES